MKTAVPLIIAVVLFSFSGCTNNLVNKWENYTGDTDVYYNAPEESNLSDNGAFVQDSDSVSADTESEDGIMLEYGLPEYWKTELDSVVESVGALIDSAGEYTSFFWYTDAHWSYGSKYSLSIIEYLEDHTGVNYTNFGGDIVNTYNIDESENIILLDKWREQSLKLSNHHSVVGNHDNDIAEFASREDLYGFLLEGEVNKVTNTDNKFCYYVDNPTERTRYIYLDTGFENTTSGELRFLINALNSTKEDWHIVLVSHIWFVYNSTATPTEGKVPDYVEPILDIIDAYNARSTGSVYWNGYINYDFSTSLAKVEFCIGGHTHVDFVFTTDAGIPVILTETDSYHLRGDGKSVDSTDEASVSVVIADYDRQTVYIIRAGRGDNGTVFLPNANNG